MGIKHGLQGVAIVALAMGSMPALAQDAPRPVSEMSCAEIKAEGMRMQGVIAEQQAALSPEETSKHVSMAPVQAQAAASVAAATAGAVAGALGGSIAGGLVGAATQGATIASAKAARDAVFADLNAYQGGVMAKHDQAMDRMSLMFQTYQDRCATEGEKRAGAAMAEAAAAMAESINADVNSRNNSDAALKVMAKRGAKR